MEMVHAEYSWQTKNAGFIHFIKFLYKQSNAKKILDKKASTMLIFNLKANFLIYKNYRFTKKSQQKQKSQPQRTYLSNKKFSFYILIYKLHFYFKSILDKDRMFLWTFFDVQCLEAVLKSFDFLHVILKYCLEALFSSK